MVQKRARLTVTPEQVRAGQFCACEACVRDGPHELDCTVHDEPPTECACGRTDQAKGAI